MLWAVARCMDDSGFERSNLYGVPVLYGNVFSQPRAFVIDNLRSRFSGNQTVSINVVVVGMRVDHERDLQTQISANVEQFLHFPSWVDDRGDLRLFISDDVGEILHSSNWDLYEDHCQHLSD